MQTHDESRPTDSAAVLVLRGLIQFLSSAAIWGGLLFGTAGTLYWPRAWIHVGTWVITMCVNLLVLLRLNRAILVFLGMAGSSRV